MTKPVKILMLAGHLRFDGSRLAVRARLHELWYLHYAGVPQGTVWGPAHQNLPLRAGSAALCFHQDIRRHIMASVLMHR